MCGISGVLLGRERQIDPSCIKRMYIEELATELN
jgi:hypothetical protein